MISFVAKGVAVFIKGSREIVKQIVLFPRFAHRRNADASFLRVCLACLLTVGTAMVDGALRDLESDHRARHGGWKAIAAHPA
jgi:hypothetical protein